MGFFFVFCEDEGKFLVGEELIEDCVVLGWLRIFFIIWGVRIVDFCFFGFFLIKMVVVLCFLVMLVDGCDELGFDKWNLCRLIVWLFELDVFGVSIFVGVNVGMGLSVVEVLVFGVLGVFLG